MRNFLYCFFLCFFHIAIFSNEINYEKDILPVLESRCYKCHSDKRQKGDLNLSKRDLILKGGETGPAVKVGNSKDSLLVKLIKSEDEDEFMPPKGVRLSKTEIESIEKWIDQGLKMDNKGDSNKEEKKNEDSKKSSDIKKESFEDENVLQKWFDLNGNFEITNIDNNKMLMAKETSGSLAGLITNYQNDSHSYLITVHVKTESSRRAAPDFRIGVGGMKGLFLEISIGIKKVKLINNEVVLVEQELSKEFVDALNLGLQISFSGKTNENQVQVVVLANHTNEQNSHNILNYEFDGAIPKGEISLWAKAMGSNKVYFDDLTLSL